MDLLHLVDRLEEQIAGAQKMPIGNRAIIDRRRMLDLIDQMRVAVPDEVREAQEIVAQRDAIRRQAEEEARGIVQQAEQHAERMVEQHEIAQTARRRAEEISEETEQRLEARLDEVNRDIHERLQESRELARQEMAAADEYARELLARLQQQLQAFMNSVQNGMVQLEPSRGRAEPEQPAPAAASDEHTADDDDRAPIQLYGETGPDQDPANDLEDLLHRPRGSSLREPEAPPGDPGVIDDYEHAPLDDDPLYRRRSDRDRDER